MLRDGDRQGQKKKIYVQLHFILQEESLHPGKQHRLLGCSSDG